MIQKRLAAPSASVPDRSVTINQRGQHVGASGIILFQPVIPFGISRFKFMGVDHNFSYGNKTPVFVIASGQFLRINRINIPRNQQEITFFAKYLQIISVRNLRNIFSKPFGLIPLAKQTYPYKECLSLPYSQNHRHIPERRTFPSLSAPVS